jgi:hypothetical protein
MRTTILLITAALLTAGCAANGVPTGNTIAAANTSCSGGASGRTDTKLKYKKDDIEMKWKSHVTDDSEFRIKLKPRTKYRDSLVKIVGVSGTLPNGNPTPHAWLDIKGTYNGLKQSTGKAIFVLCVPDVPEGTIYKFDVDIPDIGILDPRVEVVAL